MDNPQPKVSEIEYGWFAGFFDGEGSVILAIRATDAKNGSPRIQPMAKISGTDYIALERITEIFEKVDIAYHVAWYQPKGKMRSGRPYKKAWSITIAGIKRCKRFYNWITPALVLKKERAEVLLDYIRSRLSHTNFRESLNRHELDLALKMKGLNLKGKAQPYDKALTLNTEPPLVDHKRLSESGKKGAAARWGIRN